MPGQFTIELRSLRFFAGHGMYKEEMKVGNDFEVDVSITCPSPEEAIQSIDQTVDYVTVYHIISKVFSTRKLLLETCTMEIAAGLEEQFPFIKALTIVIRKLNPPITGFSGSVGVSYSKTFR
ncbi:MAG TPA: dihydroneopterin aldolase [Flavisolibacter sp.]|nr:dihydroneopterin aldolase [Flavisolibacter sp.]